MNRLIHGLVVLAVTFSSFVSSPVFAQESTEQGSTETEAAPIEFSQELKSCLKSPKTGVGEDQYAKIASGEDIELPKEAEANAEGCFEQHAPQPTGGGQVNVANLNFAPATAECLTGILGADYKTKMASGGKELRGQIGGCFGSGIVGKPQGLEEFKSCVTAAVGAADAKKLFETSAPPTPGSELSTKLFNAGCGKKMQHQINGGPPMPPEMAACFEKNGFNTKTQVLEDVGRTKAEEIQKACNLGGPGGPGGAKAGEMMACLQGLGIDPKQASRGAAAGVVSTAEIEASKKCAEQVGFQVGGHGGTMPEEVRRCLEGKGISAPGPQAMNRGTESRFSAWIRSNFIASAQEAPRPGQPGNPPQGGPQGGPPQLSGDQQQAAQGCFKGPGGGQGGGPGGPGGPGNNECFQKAGVEQGAGTPMAADKVQEIRECMSKNNIGGFGHGPGGPNGGQPGPNGQPGGPNCGEPQKDQKVRGVEKIRQLLAIGPTDREGQGQQPGNGPQCGQPGGPNGPQNGQREGQQPGQNGQGGQPGGPNCGEPQKVRGIAKIRQLLALGPTDQGQQPGNGPQCGQPGGPNGPQNGQPRPNEGQFQNNQPGPNGQPRPGDQQFQGNQPPPQNGEQRPNEGQFQNNQPGQNFQPPPPGGQQNQGSQPPPPGGQQNQGSQPPPPPPGGQQAPPPGGNPPV